MKFQTTIRQWMLGTALLAAGLACLLAVTSLPTSDELPPPVIVVLWFGGAPLFGAGLLSPFGRPILGAVLGLTGQLAYTCYYLLFLIRPCH